MKRNIHLLLIGFLALITFSCKKYLDEKPDKALAVPTSIKELQGLMNLETNNNGYPIDALFSDDNVYSPYTIWNSIATLDDKLAYNWNPANDVTRDYSGGYSRLFNSNVVLDAIDKINDPVATQADIDLARGSAYFYRAILFYELAQLFAPPYSSETKATGYGIPLRLSPGIEEKTTRSTVQQTYDQITSDARQAALFLPAAASAIPSYKIRPSKAAAYGLLARTYLSMSDYVNAEKYADSCLLLYSTLLNYNTAPVSVTATNPFPRFNDEVIFHCTARNPIALNNIRIDTALFNSYAGDDLRKTAFFRLNTDGTYNFKGNYNAGGNRSLFCGIAADEIHLIKAECLARAGQTSEAMTVLNNLLIKRWKTGFFVPFSAANAPAALMLILQERRKELCFRPSLRWTDLRRLNLDNNFKKTLVRVLNTQTYTLEPGDKRYSFLIPQAVIEISGIQQNPR